MRDFLYGIEPAKHNTMLEKNIIKKLVKMDLILTFDILKYDTNESNLILYLVAKYKYTKQNGRIYIVDKNDIVLKDIMLFCNRTNIQNVLLYSKNIKNNILATDKENSLFIRLQ